MSVIASTDIYNTNDDVLFDRKTLERLKKVDIEELPYDAPDSNEALSQDEMGGARFPDQHGEEDDESDDDGSADPETKRIESMAKGMEEYYSRQKEYKMDVNRQLQKKEKKRKMLIDQQRLKKEDVSEEEELNNDDVRVGTAVKKTTVKFADDDGDVDMSESEDDGLFVNPLLSGNKKNGSKSNKTGENAKNSDDEEKDGFSSADEADEKMLQKEKKKKEDKLIGKRKRRGDKEEEDDVGDFFANTEIEVVPQTKIRERTRNGGSDDDEDAGYSSMDSEEMAETRALAKVMLRKKNRNEIIEGTYNRYAVHEDPSSLPDWFIEDEMRHFRANNVHLVTKEMVADEKKLLKAYNERPSKKVQEAKARKKKRLAKAMNKIKTKATVIAEQQEISEGTKMRQIQKLYKKEKAKNKEEKNYVVSRNFSNIAGSKTPRNTKAVDKRMKKDRRALKARAKKDKKRNGGGRRK